MTYPKRIVLNCPSGYVPTLDLLIDDLLRDRVDLIAVTGKDHAKVEDIIDELIVGDKVDATRLINTTSHDSLDEAMEFAESWPVEEMGEVQVIEL